MTAAYVINRSPSVPLGREIPQRVWTGKDVLYRHLRVFSCVAYVHVAKYQRRKLTPKTRSCIFLGYGDDEFGYRLWNLAKKKVIRSRDIVFMEEKTIVDWEKEKSGSSSKLTERIHPDEERTQSTRSLMLTKELSRSVGSEGEPEDAPKQRSGQIQMRT